jgi:hypothetical protein
MARSGDHAGRNKTQLGEEQTHSGDTPDAAGVLGDQTARSQIEGEARRRITGTRGTQLSEKLPQTAEAA